MKAIQVSAFGPPEVLRLTELPDAAPGPGEVAVDVSHAAVGLIDVFIRQGLYRDRPGLPQPPYVPGLEVAGTVRALGQGVAGFQVGEPVVTLSAGRGTGGYAAIFVSDAAYVASMKDVNLDPGLAVAVVPNGATAYLALTQIARIRNGERVLVHVALGGLAAGFPGIARQLGASRVTGTVRASDLDAAQQAQLPYDEIIDSAQLPGEVSNESYPHRTAEGPQRTPAAWALSPDRPDRDIVRAKALAQAARPGKAPGHDRPGQPAPMAGSPDGDPRGPDGPPRAGAHVGMPPAHQRGGAAHRSRPAALGSVAGR